MIKVEEIEVWGFKHAIKGMRNPHRSWDKSDSGYGIDGEDEDVFIVGENDLRLMQGLYKAGPEHRKYLRQIPVCMDITAPLYWWKEFDTYKIGTVANSCSTMHTIHKKPFELDDFSWDKLLNTGCDLFEYTCQDGLFTFKKMAQPLQLLTDFVIPSLNVCRQKYLETMDKKYWWQMIQLLPTNFNQKRTVTMNYEVVANIIHQRENHKLDEWNVFCDIMLEKLPYLKEIIEYDKTN